MLRQLYESNGKFRITVKSKKNETYENLWKIGQIYNFTETYEA